MMMVKFIMAIMAPKLKGYSPTNLFTGGENGIVSRSYVVSFFIGQHVVMNVPLSSWYDEPEIA